MTTPAPNRRAENYGQRMKGAGGKMGAVPADSHVYDVILRDGSTLRLRPPSHSDASELLAFYKGLSPESLHLRFHGVPALRPDLVEHVLEPDWLERGALVGTLAGANGTHVVALATYDRLRDPSKAEVSFAVADELQGRGIGTRLLEQLAAIAGGQGIERFIALVLPENVAMLRVFSDAGFEIVRRLDPETYELEFAVTPTETYRARVDERDHAAVVASLRPFFEPAAVAVLGASPRPRTIGGELFRNIVAGGFEGAVYPVNRAGEAVAGVRGYASFDQIEADVDLAVICLPAEFVLDAAESLLRKGVRALCVISAGFAELGQEGAERQERLLALVRTHGARLIGPNCLGISSAAAHLNATFAPHGFPPGTIGFSSQSGALGLALLEEAESRSLGFSSFVSVGNKADVSSNDLLEYWEDDDDTSVVLLYLESFGNPRRFGRVAQRVARTKPIVAMKSGVTGAGSRAASSHTAALAGSEAAVSALFRQAGVMRCSTLEELVEVAALLSTQPLPRGRRVAILTNAGGLGILCADACDSSGLELPELSEDTRAGLASVLPTEASRVNPVDMLGSASALLYERALPLVLADPGVDAAIVIFVPAARVTAADVAAAIGQAREGSPKPVLPVLMAAERVPGSFAYPESAARALARAAERADWLRRPLGVELRPERGVSPREGAEVVESALARADDLWLRPDEVRRLLASYGVRLVPERVAAGPDEAAAAAAELGFPAVVKTAEAGVHKTERGGVALDLASDEDVRAAAERIGGAVIVQPMIAEGVELLAGVVQDPVFGPLVAFGPGGVLAELIGEAGFCLAPLSDTDARELVGRGKAGRLVAGFRGRPAADSDALVDLLGRLARLGDDLPQVAELDLNPVLGLEEGYVVVDARVRVRRGGPPSGLKSW
jgi:acetyl coenzyme A synthetase (ADP forming)-like protein